MTKPHDGPDPVTPAGAGPATMAGAGRAALPESLRRAAIEWQVTLWSGEVDTATQDAFEQWRRQDSRHEEAWQQVQRLRTRLQAAPRAATAAALRPPRDGDRPRSSTGSAARRTALVLGLATAAAWAVRDRSALMSSWETLRADFRTARGEQRRLTLPDGSRLMLDTASAASLRFDGSWRRIALHAGRILVETAADPATPVDGAPRPFVVDTVDGEILAIGTRFAVSRLDDASAVAVIAGAVAVRGHRGGETLRVEAGQQVRFDGTGPGSPGGLSPAALRWSDGWLVAEQRPLGDLLTELARYRPGLLRWDPAVAGLRVSGVYPLGDPDQALAALSEVLPVKITYRTRWWVTVSPRE